jgi:hypothetical protein
MAIKYTNIIHSKALQNIPKFFGGMKIYHMATQIQRQNCFLQNKSRHLLWDWVMLLETCKIVKASTQREAFWCVVAINQFLFGVGVMSAVSGWALLYKNWLELRFFKLEWMLFKNLNCFRSKPEIIEILGAPLEEANILFLFLRFLCLWSETVLPDGLFSNKNTRSDGKKIQGLRLANVYILWPFGIFYGRLGYFMTIWYILCSLGTFFRFWYHAQRKIWQPWSAKIETR